MDQVIANLEDAGCTVVLVDPRPIGEGWQLGWVHDECGVGMLVKGLDGEVYATEQM